MEFRGDQVALTGRSWDLNAALRFVQRVGNRPI
jgi:hypothetical protein